MPLSAGAPRIVIKGGYGGRFVRSGRGSTSEGHLIYMKQDALFAVPFDLRRLESTGPSVPVLEGVDGSVNVGSVQITFSTEGTGVYIAGSSGLQSIPINWMTRDGAVSDLRATRAIWGNPRFSPNGLKIAMDIWDGPQRNIWVYEWKREILTD